MPFNRRDFLKLLAGLAAVGTAAAVGIRQWAQIVPPPPKTRRLEVTANEETLKWSPKDLDGLLVWLKAGSGLYSDKQKTKPAQQHLEPVAVWEDQSGHGNDESVSSGYTPVLDTLIFPGLKLLQFKNSRLQSSAIPAMDTGQQTIFAVFLPDPIAPTLGAIFVNSYATGAGSKGASAEAISARLTGTALQVYSYSTEAKIKRIESADLNPNFRVLEVRLDNNTLTCRDNGEMPGNPVDGVTLTPQGHIANLTGNSPGGNIGIIGEKLIYNRALTDEECALVRNYLMNKFWQPFKRVQARPLWQGTEPLDWLGRSCLLARAGVWMTTYVVSSGHSAEDSACRLHIRFSTDEGITWSEANHLPDGSAVSGFPLKGHGTNLVGNGSLTTCPNGELLLHAWERTVPEGRAVGTFQYRSADGGASWQDEGLVNDDIGLIVESHLRAGVGLYMCGWDLSKANFQSTLYSSFDNGQRWNVVSNVTSREDDSDEWSVANPEGATLMAVLRHHPMKKTYLRLSQDMGASWGALTDISASVGVVHRPLLKVFADEPGRVYLFGRLYHAAKVEALTMWYTDDMGKTWSPNFNIDPFSYVDTGYHDCLKRANGDFYILGYTGNMARAQINEYVVRKTSK